MLLRHRQHLIAYDSSIIQLILIYIHDETDLDEESAKRQANKVGGRYEVKACDDDTFFPGRQVSKCINTFYFLFQSE